MDKGNRQDALKLMSDILEAIPNGTFRGNNKKNTKMEDKVKEFDQVYHDYFTDKKNDEDLTQITTQPYWQSLRLSKKRIDDNGLKMDIEINEEVDPKRKYSNFEDDKNEVGNFRRNVIVKKSINKDGKKIYKKKEKKLAITSAIKFKGEGDTAACPNCGNIGKISSYIDGCDFCDSKFDVTEFEEKISAFSLEDDLSKKIKHVFKSLFWSLLSIVIIGVIAAIASLVFVIYNDINSGSIEQSSNASIVFILLFSVLPVLIKVLFFTIILFLVMGVVIYFKNYQRIVKDNIYYEVERSINGFSAEDFAQQLEYKLRNIHFAYNVDEANLFANVDLEKVFSTYSNVIECNLMKIKFLGVNKEDNKYFVDLIASIKISRIVNNRIKVENEQLFLKLSGIESMTEKQIGAIRLYPCKSCGASISLLDGGVCSYCGEKLNYEEYSWMIESYISNVPHKKINTITEKVFSGNRKPLETFTRIRLQLIAVYVFTFIIGLLVAYNSNKGILNPILHMDEYIEFANQRIDEMIKLDEVSSDVSLVYEDREYAQAIYRYVCKSDIESVVENYTSNLKEQGFNTVDKYDGHVEVEKVVREGKIEGNQEVEIRYYEDTIIVEICFGVVE